MSQCGPATDNFFSVSVFQPLHSWCCYPTSFQQMIMFSRSLSEFSFCSENEENLIKNGVRQPWRGSSHTLIAGSRKIRILSTSENMNHVGILFPALKKEDSSVLWQQSSNHCVQPMRKHQNCKLLFFSKEILFRAALPSFFLKPNKSWPSLCLFELACFTIPCLLWTEVLCFLKPILLVK